MNDLYEAPSRMEPCLLDEPGMRLADLASDLAVEAERLGSRLHPRSAASLAGMVRALNCHYSNLIEGHNTSLRDIEAALAGNLAQEEGVRNRQIEARAHVRLQAEIDRQHAQGTLAAPASTAFIRWLHREFYRDATPAMLVVTSKGGRRLTIEPGELRSRPEEEVIVGNHQPPSSNRVADYMARFEERYRTAGMGRTERILAVAAAHHRLNFIHPFLDGNGRVSRLVSHAMALQAGIGSHGLWSVSRGLARGLESRGEYKQMMARADMPRQGDLDGRGNLSRRALRDFTEWFLRVCLDQVRFMGTLFALETLAARLANYVRTRGLKAGTQPLLEQILVRGEVPRGDAPAITGLRDRAARDLLSSLVDDGIIGSDTPKGAVSLRFHADAIEILFPTLFPKT